MDEDQLYIREPPHKPRRLDTVSIEWLRMSAQASPRRHQIARRHRRHHLTPKSLELDPRRLAVRHQHPRLPVDKGARQDFDDHVRRKTRKGQDVINVGTWW